MGVGFGTDILAGLVEGKPTIPDFKPIDLQQEQTKAIQGNTSSLPALEAQATQINQFNVDSLSRILRQVIPGYDQLTKGAESTIADELAGKVPKDVQDLLQSSDAARAIGGGFSGSGMHGNLVARDLGITSLDLTQRGLDSAGKWLQTMNAIANPGLYNFTNMFVTPTQQYSVDANERDSKFQRDYVSNMNDWQHSFGYYAAQDIRDTGNTVMSLLSSYMGGSLGKSGGSNSGQGGSGGGGEFGGGEP